MSVIHESVSDDGSPRREKEQEETFGTQVGIKDHAQFTNSPKAPDPSAGRGQSALGKTRTARIKNQQEAMLAKLANLKKLQEAHRSGQRKPGSQREELNSEDQASPSGLKPSELKRTFTPLESTISSRNTQQSKDKGGSKGAKYADGEIDRSALKMADMKLGASQ